MVVQEREGTYDKIGVGRTKDDNAATVQPKITRDITQAHTPPASTITERMPRAKRRLPATIKECIMHTRDPRSGGAHGVDGRCNPRGGGGDSAGLGRQPPPPPKGPPANS